MVVVSMRLVIPDEFVSQSGRYPDKYDMRVPTVGDLVNRRPVDRFPFITVDKSDVGVFSPDECPELSGRFRCMDVGDSVFELKANAVDILSGETSGHTEVLDLQDIRAGCSAYIAGRVLPREELLGNGGMMYQYTKYLTSPEPMVDSMRDLIRAHPGCEYGHAAAGPESPVRVPARDTRDLYAAADDIAERAAFQAEM